MEIRRRLFKSLFLLTLFVAYQAGITMFSHVHFVNGTMIVHSHPSNNGQHTHTQGQILTFEQISSFVGIEPLVETVRTIYFLPIYVLDFNKDSGIVSSLYKSAIYLRAPPCYY